MPEHRSKLSSGTLLYRQVTTADGTSPDGTRSLETSPASNGDSDGTSPIVEVLLVHPAGNYNRRAPWGIPKGAPDPDETLDATARRETLEETGLVVDGPLVDLGHVDYTRSKKRVYAFAGPAPDGASPRCASWEVDKAEFIEISRARRIIHPDQAVLLDRLLRHLAIDPGQA